MVVLAPALPYIFGAASMGSSLLNTFGKQREYDARNAEIRAANRASIRQYEYQEQRRQHEWRQALSIYGQKQRQYQQQVKYNNTALTDAWFDEQVRLNEIYDEAKWASLEQQQKLLEVSGVAAARGQTGKRAGLRDQNNAMKFGMAQAKRQSNLARATQATERNMDRLRMKTNYANQLAYADVAVAPMLGPASMYPTMRQGYDTRGLMTAGIFGSLLDGVKAGVGFAA